MDRIDFSKSLDIDTPIQVSNIFNEILTMYNLLADYEINVNGTMSENGIIVINASFENTQEAIDASKVLHSEGMRINDELYSLINELDKNTLNLVLTKL